MDVQDSTATGERQDDRRYDRATSSAARVGLGRLASSQAIGNGAVNLIGLDAIRNQLGERWPARCETIWEHVERDLEKRMGRNDVVLRLNETNYLVAMQSVSGGKAQATCVEALEEILHFFLGESQARNVLVRNVTSLRESEVCSIPLDPSAIDAGEAPPPAEVNDPPHGHDHEPEHHADWKPPLAGRKASAIFSSALHKQVQVRIGVEGVWNLRRDLVTSFLIERATFPDVTDSTELLHLDVEVMNYASQLLHEHKGIGGKLTLHTPMSFDSLSSIRSRAMSIKMVGHIDTAMRDTTLIEIAHLDPGVPPSRLIEVVSLTKPYCLGVLARVRPSRKALDAIRGCGLKGVILEIDKPPRNRGDAAALMRAFGEAAKDIAPNLIVHGLEDASMIEAAKAAGLTHASVRPELKFDPPAGVP